VSCSICSSIRSDQPSKLRRSALQENLPQLQQLGAGERNDLLSVPGARRLFHWQSEDGIQGELTWIRGKLADALGKFIHRTGAPEEAQSRRCSPPAPNGSSSSWNMACDMITSS
jgi:hypothetical protein